MGATKAPKQWADKSPIGSIETPNYEWNHDLLEEFANASIQTRHNPHPPAPLTVVAPEGSGRFVHRFLEMTASYYEKELPELRVIDLKAMLRYVVLLIYM
jgi:hypothetical protein